MLLPPLRQELSLHPGPQAADGSPSWTLHDPAANRFYQLGWPAFEILSRWSLGSAEAIIAAVNRDTTLSISTTDIEALLTLLSGHHLLLNASAEYSESLLKSRAAGQLSKLQWLLHHYLFFRVPLLRPEPLLARLSPRLGFVYQSRFWWLLAGLALLGLYLVSRRWDEFTHTFSAYQGVQGLIGIGLALSVAKVLHELGHGLTAYRHGCRVPSMGAAFLVLWPVLYTDTNEAWKLPSRRARLQIGAAGMLAELALAVLATLLWVLLPEGPLRAGAFFLATTTWLATLAINASPFMRFDGYFLLSDWLNLPNLHARAFAQGRWWLREALFGLGDAPPEPFPAGRRRFLIGFAFATWLYRLVLFLGIALLVYHFFFKALGILLLLVELAWFVFLPIWSELKVWWQRRADIPWNRQSRRTAALLAGLLLLLCLPWQSAVRAPMVMMAAQAQGLYTPAAAEVLRIAVQEGQTVKAGALLAELRSPELEAQWRQAEAEAQRLRWQVEQQAFSSSLMEAGPALYKRWQAAEAAVQGLAQQKAQLRVVAPFAGTVVEANASLRTGAWLPAGEKLFQLVGPQGIKAEAFVTEAQLDRLNGRQTARLIPDRPEVAGVDCQVSGVDRVNISVLDKPYLASSYGGPLPTQLDAQQAPLPLQALFRVRLDDCTQAQPLTQELAGIALLQGERQSWLGRGLRQGLALWQQEAGL